MKRPKYSVYIATSIDGYIAKLDGDVGWLDVVNSPSEDYGYKEFFNTIDVVVLGRNTYEKVINFLPWPYAGKEVIVFSKTLATAQNGVEIFSGDIYELNNKLFSKDKKHIYIDGGITICSFLKAKLVDQMTISIVPIFLGSGIKLFTNVTDVECKLKSSEVYP